MSFPIRFMLTKPVLFIESRSPTSQSRNTVRGAAFADESSGVRGCHTRKRPAVAPTAARCSDASGPLYAWHSRARISSSDGAHSWCSRWQQSAMPRWAWRAWAWVLAGKRQGAAAFKADLPCIKCDVCEIVASEVFREVEKPSDAAPMTVKNTKPGAPKVQVRFSEADVSAVLEGACNRIGRSPARAWYVDLVETAKSVYGTGRAPLAIAPKVGEGVGQELLAGVSDAAGRRHRGSGTANRRRERNGRARLLDDDLVIWKTLSYRSGVV